VLDHITSISNTGNLLTDQLFSSSQNLEEFCFSASPYQNRHAGDFDDTMVVRRVVRRVGFDDVSPKFNSLSDQRHDLFQIASTMYPPA
jgi:hypothetical protein